MTLLQQIKKSMRITHNILDELIETDIESGTLDMVRIGIQPYQKDADGEYILDENENKILKEDALIYKAIELFSKAQENYQSKGEQYNSLYESLRDSMGVCDEYRK